MGRSVILGNGSLTIGLNEQGLVNDFYYPYVGLDNLNTSRSMHHRIGVWVDDAFSWTDNADWHTDVRFESDALITEVISRNDKLRVTLEFKDFVDWELNAFCRQVTVKNLAETAREIRLFMHQVFEISRRGRGDTALYVPDEHYILDYKGRCSLLVYGRGSRAEFDQFSVGNFAIEDKEGTYIDAEDGVLSGNAVEHGGVDSVLRLSGIIGPSASETYDYWVVASDSQYDAEKVHVRLKQEGVSARMSLTRQRWQKWLATANDGLLGLPEEQRIAATQSLMTIKAHTDKRGGVIASCDSSIYNYSRDYYSYVWPRDGAYAMWPLIKLGFTEEPKRFFEFCRDILSKDGYMMHKYQPDRAIGSTWHPLLHGRHSELAIQEDETAIIVFMIGEYLNYSQDSDFVFSLYETFIRPAANFLASYIDEHTRLPHASYDLWEEKFLTSTYSTAVTYRALLTAATLADRFDFPEDLVKWQDAAKSILSGATVFFEHERRVLRKGFLLQDDGSLQFDNLLDMSSLYGAWKFGLYAADDEFIAETVAQAETILLAKSPAGGAPRYEHDAYLASKPAYMGNPWFVTTLWMAQYYAGSNRLGEAQRLLEWSLKLRVPSGMLSEQVEPTTGVPLSVTPLVWSHAELINTLLDIKASQQG